MNQHLIYKQKATVTVAKESEAHTVQKAISDAMHNELPGLLQAVFDSLTPGGNIIRIDCLQLDLGVLPAQNIRQAFADTVAEKIREAIVAKQDKEAVESNASVIRKEQSLREAFLYFLQYGAKPWFMAAQSRREWETAMQQGFAEDERRKIVSWLRQNHRQQPVIIDRLIQQFSPRFSELIISSTLSFGGDSWRDVYRDLLLLATGKTDGNETEERRLLSLCLPVFLTEPNAHNALYRVIKSGIVKCIPATDTTNHHVPGTHDKADVIPGNVESEYDKFYFSKVLITTVVRNAVKRWQQEEVLSQKQVREMGGLNDENSLQELPAKESVLKKKDGEKITDEIIEKAIKEAVGDEPAKKEAKRKRENNQLPDIPDLPEHLSDKKDALSESDKEQSPQAELLQAARLEDRNETGDDTRHLPNAGETSSEIRSEPGFGLASADATSSIKKKKATERIEKEPQYVSNSGIVLLHPFLEMYFTELHLLREKRFIDNEAQGRAVLLLHYLATGETEGEEWNLLLQKLVCGFPFDETLPSRIELTEEEKTESDQLLQSVINYCPPLKNTSLAGLRSTFLQRDGRIEKKENSWLLTVEQKTVDVLLDKLPWGFSTIKFSWLADMINVDWC